LVLVFFGGLVVVVVALSNFGFTPPLFAMTSPFLSNKKPAKFPRRVNRFGLYRVALPTLTEFYT
jgi:hypothetical protein